VVRSVRFQANNGTANDFAAQRAMSINPSMPEAWDWLSWNLLMAGDPEGCIAALELTIRLNPLGPFTFILYINFSQAYWELGDYEAGLEGRRAQPDLSPELVQGIDGVERPEIDARRDAVLRRAMLE